MGCNNIITFQTQISYFRRKICGLSKKVLLTYFIHTILFYRKKEE